MDWSWVNGEAIGALVACVAVIVVPITIRVVMQRRAQSRRQARLDITTICQSCGVETPRLGFLDFFAFEGWFIIAWMQMHYSSVVCESCAKAMVEHARSRARKTWWKSFPLGHFIVLLTFTNSRAALKAHTKSITEVSANNALNRTYESRAEARLPESG